MKINLLFNLQTPLEQFEVVPLNLTNYLLPNHFLYQFKILTCISGVDYPDAFYFFNKVATLGSYISTISILTFFLIVINLQPVKKNCL